MPDSEKQEVMLHLHRTAEIRDPKIVSTTEPKVMVLDKEDEILAELKKISAALEKAPPPTPPKGFVNEFKDFLSKYKIFGLAVAFILALYAGILIQALVKDFIIPLLGLIIPGMSDLASFTATINESSVWHWRLSGSVDYLHYSRFGSFRYCESS